MIPEFQDFEYYAIYPQTSDIIGKVINLNFSKDPDNLLRLFYVIKKFKDMPQLELKEPIIDSQFNRSGYFVTEWGVVLK